MDRSLDDVISDRKRENSRRGRGRRQFNAPRDGIRKNQRDEPRNLDRDWVHDRYEDDDDREDRQPPRNYRAPRNARRSPEVDLTQPGAKVRVDNIHYDLTEDDLRELFTRMGPLHSAQLLYDRQDRSRGIAYINYVHARDAQDAIREFNGANANGQPIQLQLLPTPASASASGKPRNPFDHVERPTRSLFDRIEPGRSASPGEEDDGPRMRGGGRNGARHSDVSKPVPEHIDRYVPGQSDRRRSPARRNRDSHRGAGGRAPGQRREGERTGRPRKDAEGHVMVQGRPRKTQQELDAEMEDYFGGGESSAPTDGANDAAAVNGNVNGAAPAPLDDDIDMIE